MACEMTLFVSTKLENETRKQNQDKQHFIRIVDQQQPQRQQQQTAKETTTATAAGKQH